MKKMFLTSVLSLSAVFAASDSEILSLYNNPMSAGHGLSVKIEKREAIKEFPGIDMVVLKITQGEQSQNDVVFTHGDFIIPDLFNIKTGVSYKADFMEKALSSKLSSVYKKESSKNIIKLGNDPKKPTILILSDPECPYCRRELDSIEDRLKESNVEMIMTAIHGATSHAKSFKIYQETEKAKSDAEKIKLS